jgi:AcrR family transcriptional regulator
VGTAERRARERAARRAAIVATARELAEQEGWDAVTTRRLADRIEYSQPVLYGHFAGRDAIVTAVALEGFTELADDLRARAGTASGPRDAVEAVVVGYLAFARAHPATYHAMFTATTDLRFAADDTPAELRGAFAALRAPVAALARVDGHDADLRTELLWSTLHGLATLEAAGRVPARRRPERVALLLRSLDPGRP